MSKKWLVVDLRNRQFAIAHMYLGEMELDWESNNIDYWLDPETYNSAFEVDLSFFREEGAKGWRFTRRSDLDKLSTNVKKLPYLFDLTDEQLKADKSLLRLFYNEIKNARNDALDPLLFLYDDEKAVPLIQELCKIFPDDPSKTRPESKYYLLRQKDSLEGYALLNPESPDLPIKNSHFTCQISNDKGQIEYLSFRWDGTRFNELCEAPAMQLGKGKNWKRRKDLERAGAAAFALIWSQKLAAVVAGELEKLQKEVAEKKALLKQVDTLMRRLNLAAAVSQRPL